MFGNLTTVRSVRYNKTGGGYQTWGSCLRKETDIVDDDATHTLIQPHHQLRTVHGEIRAKRRGFSLYDQTLVLHADSARTAGDIRLYRCRPIGYQTMVEQGRFQTAVTHEIR